MDNRRPIHDMRLNESYKLIELVRPSITEDKVGDCVLIEFIINQSKKHSIEIRLRNIPSK